jgi:GNAT superfamily N-acetyltransferase
MIRPATVEDLDPLVDMAQSLVGESPVFNLHAFSRTKVRDFLGSLLRDPNGILLVSDVHGTLMGAMAGSVAEHPFSYEKYAFDFGLFVLPGFRGHYTAKRLVSAFEARAKELGAKDVRPGIMTAVHVSRTTQFYEQLGYTLTGTQLIKVL